MGGEKGVLAMLFVLWCGTEADTLLSPHREYVVDFQISAHLLPSFIRLS